MSTTRGRSVAPSQVIFDLADIFGSDGFTRVTGLNASSFALQVYRDNTLQGWTLVSGVGVADTAVVAGKVYISPITNGPYSLRWRPNAVGFWRILLTYSAGFQILAQDYDVAFADRSTATATSGPGLHTSFMRPGDRDS